MKKLLFLLLLITPVFASIPIEVVKIYDGDTIKVKIETGNQFSIRLVGIDCYETQKIHRAYKQAYINYLDIDEVIKKGKNATKYVEKLYENSTNASFDFQGIDEYGRALGIVYFDDLNVNEELKNKGICQEYAYKEK